MSAIKKLTTSIFQQVESELTCLPDSNNFVTAPTGSYTVPTNVQVGLRNFTVNKVMSQAFIDTPGLTEVTIPNTVTEIQSQAFWNCKDLETVNLPESLEKIDQWAFQYCTGLKNITLPNSLTTIGNGAFFGSGLTEIHIPASVTSIGQGVVADCDALGSITVDENNPVYDSRDGKLGGEDVPGHAIIETASNTLIAGCEVTRIPCDVTTIGKNAFQGLDQLYSVTLPPSVTAIEHWAFADCANLSNFFVYGTAAPTLASGDSYPFTGCSALTEVYVRPGTADSYTGGWENFSIQEIQNPYLSGSVWCELDFDNATAVVVAHPDGEYTGDIKIWSNFSSTACGQFAIDSIANRAFYGCNLTSITIGEGIKKIGNHAFWGVNGVAEVVLPESVEYIGTGAFGRAGFQSINVPAGVTHIGNAAFAGSPNLTTLNVHEDNAHYCNVGASLYTKDMTWLCSVSAATEGEFVIPASVDSVHNFCFENCDKITKIVVPEGVWWPCDGVGTNHEAHFYGCNASFEVTQNGINYAIADLNNNAASVVAPRAEYGSARYKGVVEVPESMSFYYRYHAVTAVGNNAFADCNEGTGLTGVALPNSVQTIGERAFCNSHYLPSIDIPASVTSIGYNAFYDCLAMTAINVAAENTAYSSIDGVLFDKEATTLIRFPKNKTADVYSIPNTVTKIEDWAFARCTALNGVEIPNSVQTIGSWAFWFTHIDHLVIPASVSYIGDYAFQNDSDNPEELDIQSLTMLGTTPPAIASEALTGAGDLATIYVPAGAEANYNVAPWNNYNVVEMDRVLVDGLYYKVNTETLTAEVARYEEDNNYSGDIVIPASISVYGLDFAVTSIGERAFSSCTGLTSIEIPNSVTSIGNHAFYACKGLTIIEIPASVTSIGAGSFIICSGLTNIEIAAENPVYDSRENCNAIIETATNTLVQGCNETVIPASVTSIGNFAFCSCTGLTSIEIPASVTSIGVGAFNSCSGLTSIEIPNSVTSIGAGAFEVCEGLTSIVVAAENLAYASVDDVLYNKELTTLILYPEGKSNAFFAVPNTVTTIGAYSMTFGKAQSLAIPASVTKIESNQTFFASAFESVTLYGTQPPALDGTNIFDGCSNLTTIYVPAGAEANYNVAPWNNYTIKAIPYPEQGKYYILKSRVPNNWVVGENATNQVELVKDWTTPDAWTVADHASFIWKAQVEGQEVELQNIYSKKWMKSHPSLYKAYTTVDNNQSTYTITHQGGNYFMLFDEELNTTTAYMHADTLYNLVVRWDGNVLDTHGWEFVEVPADVVEALLAQMELNEHVKWQKNYLMQMNCFVPETLKSNFKNHGILDRDGSVLSTNKQEPTEGPIANLLDGVNETFFHSTWSRNGGTEFHYLQADLAAASSELLLRYTRRVNMAHNDAPKTIRVMGSKDLEEWKDLGVYTLEYNETYFGIENWGGSLALNLDDTYFHLRFVVEETIDGRITGDNLFFNLSEFGIWGTQVDAKYTANLSDAQLAEIESALLAAQSEVEADAATQATLDRLLAIQRLLGGLVALTDGQVYTQAVEQEASRITYTRNFKNTNWQAWYVPFDIAYDDISDEFTVARINGVHEYDDNDDGEFDRWTVEVLKLRPGVTVYANLPYVIRANAKVNKQFAVENTTLYPADEQSIDCSTTTVLYTFKGVYSPMAGTVLRENGWFAMGGGGLVTPTASSTLNPNRWYLAPTARGGYAEYYTPKRIELVVVDEEGGVTSIEDMPLSEGEDAVWPADVYDLNGRLVKAQAENLDDLPKGIYVVNGEKIVK